MPFQFGPWDFTQAGINRVGEMGGVYGLARPTLANRARFTILYVGKTGNLRARLREHLNIPPASGITHFFAEAHGTDAVRTQREVSLIQEFQPVGNTLHK